MIPLSKCHEVNLYFFESTKFETLFSLTMPPKTQPFISINFGKNLKLWVKFFLLFVVHKFEVLTFAKAKSIKNSKKTVNIFPCLYG